MGAYFKAALRIALVKNLLFPCVLAACGWALGLHGLPLAVMVVVSSLPVGANVFLFTQRYGVGQDEEEVRTGNAMILDPYGRIIVETWVAADAMVSAILDFSLIDMCTGQRWLRGRRPQLYGILTQISGNELDARQTRFSVESTHQPVCLPDQPLNDEIISI